MNEEIKAIIKKNLPAEVGDVLKETLLQGERDAKAVKDLTTALNARTEERDKFNRELTKHSELTIREVAVTKRELEVEAKERNLEITILKHTVSVAERLNNKHEEFLALLVKNPRAVELLNENRAVPIFENYSGGGGYHTTRNEHRSATKELKESKSDYDLPVA